MRSNKKNTQGEKGFTLIEILIVILVSSLLLAAFFTLFEWHNKMYNFQQAVVRTSGSSRASLQAMSLYLSQAHRIVGSQTFDGITYTSGNSEVIGQLPSVNDSGDILTDRWDYAVFYADGNNLYQIIFPDASSSRPGGKKLLSDALDTVNFTFDNASFYSVKEVSVDLQTKALARSQLVTARLQQNIYLKNY